MRQLLPDPNIQPSGLPFPTKFPLPRNDILPDLDSTALRVIPTSLRLFPRTRKFIVPLSCPDCREGLWMRGYDRAR